MKVVINACYGGFGLSREGEIAFLARKGKQPFFYAEVQEEGKPFSFLEQHDYVRVNADQARSHFMTTTLTEDVGERASYDVIWPGGKQHPSYFYNRDIPRDDPDLIAVVEEMGGKESSWAAKLVVVEIPDDVKWHIEEYDGLEWIAEDHRTWGVNE